MDAEEVARRIPDEPVGTHLLANRGAIWQKYKEGWWRVTESGLGGEDIISSDQEMVARIKGSQNGIYLPRPIWTLY